MRLKIIYKIQRSWGRKTIRELDIEDKSTDQNYKREISPLKENRNWQEKHNERWWTYTSWRNQGTSRSLWCRNRRERLMVKHRGIFKKKRGGTTSTWRSEEYLSRKIEIDINSMEDEESLLIGVSNGVGEMLHLCGFWSNMEEAAAHNRKYISKRFISLT